MVRIFHPTRITGLSPDGRQLWRTSDDRWTTRPDEAEIIEDEAHCDIRLLDAEIDAAGLSDIRLEDVRVLARAAS